MRMSRRLAVYSVGNGTFDETSFTYTGEYLFSGGDKWTLKFLTSGRLTLLKDVNIDIFAVGGGGGGGNGNNGSYGGQGGGGGYTTTVKAQSLAKNVPYTVTIGAGGAAHTSGGASSFGELCTAQGGGYGANGGDGFGNGGSGGGVPGSTAKTWAKRVGGAGGRTYGASSSGPGGAGGAGGGGNGNKWKMDGLPGETNTGGGGGGGGGHKSGGAGGSGIVIIRAAQ